MPTASEQAEAEVELSPENQDADPSRGSKQATKSRPESEKKDDTLPPWAVILHNDDINSMEFVIESLLKVFTMNAHQAVKLTLQAHTKGRAMVWSGHRELAELKASQLTGRGADPLMAHRGAKPLRVTVEKMPG